MTKRFLIILVALLWGNVGVAGILPDVSPSKQYEFATEYIKVGDWNNAERAFKEFVEKNPSHELAGNAQYWYAETFRVRGLHKEAAEAYFVGYQKYHKSEKGPINLLKLGIVLVKIGDKKNGCILIQGVSKQYPKAKKIILKSNHEFENNKCNIINPTEDKVEMEKIINKAKDTCKSLGFKEGTDKFADCSLKLYSQSVELAAKSNQTVVMQPQSSGSSSMTIYDPVRDSRALMKQGQRMLSGRCTLGIDC